MLGNKNNLTTQERFESDQKVQQTFVLIYLINVFTYSMAIVLLSYQQYINFNSKLSTDFELLIYNWQQSPIINLTIPNQSQNATLFIQIENQNFSQFKIDEDTIMLKWQKLNSFTFLNNFTLKPNCETGYKLCGGVELNSKYCILNTTLCPYNDLLISSNFTSGQLKNLNISFKEFTSYFYDLELNNTAQQKRIMLLSTFQSKQPITDIRFGYNGKVCKNTQQFINCDSALLNYNLIAQMNASDFSSINPNNLTLFSKNNGTVGLFAERYIEFDIKCRYTLIERIIESPNYYTHLADILYIQTIGTLVYCIFIGIFLNLIHFFMLSDFSFLLVIPSSDPNKVKIIRRLIYIVRLISFIPFGTIICLLYFYEAQFNDTINRIYKNNCIQKEFEYIFADTLDQISSFRSSQIAIFWIFITALIIEVLASFVVVYRSANIKKKNLIKIQYEHEVEINHDEIQQFQPQLIKKRPTVRASFNPNEQKAIRQTITGERKSYRNNNQLMEIGEQQGEFEFNRNSAKPVWEPDQQPIPLQSPINYQLYNKAK